MNVEFIKERMSELGMSNAELARKAGITPPMVHYILSGKNEPTFSKAVKIAKALDIRLDKLA